MLGNESFDREEIVRAHREAAIRRMAGYGGTILAVQDTTGVNYNTHLKTEGIGYSSDKTLGVNIHSCLAVTSDGLVLGLLDQSSYNRPEAKDEGARVFNANAASYRIASRGTVTFAGMSSYGKDSTVKCLMKTFVNLTKDGESAKPRASYFGFDGLELRPVDDLAKAKPGKKVRVEALLNGKPQSGVVVYSGHKDIRESLRLSPVLEYSEKADPILDAGVTDINGIVELTLPKGAGELKDVYIFTDGHLGVEGVRYRSTINFTLKK
ncbi:MAG: DUF4198 domain-containing protein [Treponema sp.]|jgi:hypothetical protein|nr:DUF4198 domain-containing protein [Treponema sp.]